MRQAVKRGLSRRQKILSLLVCYVLMISGLLLFKFIPMYFYGANILFDASAHVVFTSFVLYCGWYFIDRHATLRIPYLLLAMSILVVLSIQRLLVGAHNDVGILLGWGISVVAIVVSRWRYFHREIGF